jgi:hypothetical protein
MHIWESPAHPYFQSLLAVYDILLLYVCGMIISVTSVKFLTVHQVMVVMCIHSDCTGDPIN